MWERFFNWQSDMDWTWGPFLPLRPAQEEAMRPWVWVRLFMVLSLAGALLVALGGGVCVFGPRVAVWQHWIIPPLVQETFATLMAMIADPALQGLLLGIGLSLPLLFFLFCLPFHAAWNRRAARLSVLLRSDVPKTDASKAQADVWPPAPGNLPNSS